MPVPNLLHPLPVTVQRISKSTTRYDRDAREVIGVERRMPDVVLDGQLSSSLRKIAFEATRAGPLENEDGYVLFRMADLKVKGLVDADRPLGFRQSDRISNIAGLPTSLYVIRLEPSGTYSGLGFTLVKAYCDDRDPAKTV